MKRAKTSERDFPSIRWILTERALFTKNETLSGVCVLRIYLACLYSYAVAVADAAAMKCYEHVPTECQFTKYLRDESKMQNE